MKKQIFNLQCIFLVIFSGLALTSCSDDDDAGANPDGNAQITVRMVDAPGDYDAVNLDVEEVQVKTGTLTDGDTEEEWTSLETEAGIYNLLDLTGGVSQLLVDDEIPAGYIDQIRLVLGDNNSIEIDGEELALATPSAQQSGLKIMINDDLDPGEIYNYILDFDVEESIVTQGSGNYILKPVIRLSETDDTGIISGSVHPTTFKSLVTATNANASISAYTDADGHFSLHGVPEGIYQITVEADPDAEVANHTKIIDNVEVNDEETVELETIFLE